MPGTRQKSLQRETNNNVTNKLYSVLQGVSAAKKIEQRKRGSGSGFWVILNRAIRVALQQVIFERRLDGGVDIGKKASRKRE